MLHQIQLITLSFCHRHGYESDAVYYQYYATPVTEASNGVEIDNCSSDDLSSNSRTGRPTYESDTGEVIYCSRNDKVMKQIFINWWNRNCRLCHKQYMMRFVSCRTHSGRLCWSCFMRSGSNVTFTDDVVYREMRLKHATDLRMKYTVSVESKLHSNAQVLNMICFINK